VCPDCGYRVDLLVEDKLIIELKSVEQIKGTLPQGHLRGAVADLHAASGSEDRSPLTNFNPTNPKSGIKRFVLLRALRVLRGETILYLHSEEQARSSTCGTTHCIGREGDRSVHISDTAIIISYHELSTLDRQSHSCYDKRDEKVRG